MKLTTQEVSESVKERMKESILCSSVTESVRLYYTPDTKKYSVTEKEHVFYDGINLDLAVDIYNACINQ